MIESIVESMKKKTAAKSSVMLLTGISTVVTLAALVSIIAAFEYVEAKDGFSLTPTYRKNIERCSGKVPSKKDVQLGNITSGGVLTLGLGAVLGTVFKYFYLYFDLKAEKSLKSAQFWIQLLIKVILMIPGFAVAGVAYYFEDSLDAITLMLVLAAIPLLYISFICYSGLEVYIYNKFIDTNQVDEDK